MKTKENLKLTELGDNESKALFFKICDDIILNIELAKKRQIGDLSDIGNEIGIAVGSNTCKDEKNLNIMAFEKSDFLAGFSHGFSLSDGSHG